MLDYISQAESFDFPTLSSLDGQIDKFPSKIQDSLSSLIESALDLSDMTTQTHYRVSKCDLPRINHNRLNFTRILILEALQIAFNWSLKIPDSVVLFNARFTPYIAPFFLAKFLQIPVYIHERGRKTDFSFFFNQLPSGGYGTHDLLQNHRHSVDHALEHLLILIFPLY